MLVLDTSTKLQVILAGAKATTDSPVIVSSTNLTSTTDVPAISTSLTNGATAVDVLAAPASGTQLIKSISVFNTDTAAITLTIRTNNGGTTRTLFKTALAIGDSLQYEDRLGFCLMNSAGQVKQTSSPFKLIRTPSVLGPGTTSYKIPSNCIAIFVELVGAGGGGGGCTASVNNPAAGGGGAGGGYMRAWILNPQTTTITTVVPTSAAGGSGAAAANGTDGSDATMTVNSVVYTAKGGKGGTGMATGTLPLVALGGVGQIPTNGDINIAGQPGGPGIRINTTIAIGGNGGSSVIGSGARALITDAIGNAGLASGGGGSGSTAISTNRTGGAGATGVIIIHEYSI